jgi:hypothetical protein
MHKPYCYVFVRIDIPLADQGVQIAHVALEAGKHFQHPSGVRLVLLRVKNHSELMRISKYLLQHDVEHRMFYEPDDAMCETAIATEDIYSDRRELFRKFQLWQPGGDYYGKAQEESASSIY